MARPDAQIITSMPGLGTILGARMLAEVGDDRERFTDARGLKAFAGTAPRHPRLGHQDRRLSPHRAQ